MENMKSAVQAYKTAQVDAAILGATPYELVGKLLVRAIESVGDAKGFMQKGEIEAKGQAIKIAISIIADGLRSSLNMEAGGEIAENLNVLYEYILDQLMKAHAENDTAILDEVTSLLKEIKEGWDGIKPVPIQPELQTHL